MAWMATGGSARWSAGASTPSATNVASGASPRATATSRTATSPASQTLDAGLISIFTVYDQKVHENKLIH